MGEMENSKLMQKLKELEGNDNKKSNGLNKIDIMTINEEEEMEQLFEKCHGEILSENKLNTLSKSKSNKLRKMELLQSKSRNVSVDESEDVNSKEMDDLFEKCIAEILDENYPICNDKKNTE